MKLVILFLGVVGTSFSSIFARWSTAPSPVLVLYRMLLSILVFSVPVFLKEREQFKKIAKKTYLSCLLSGIFLGLHFITFFNALKHTSVAATSVLVHTEVLFVALEMMLILKQRLPKPVWFSIVLALCGSVIVTLGDSSGEGTAILGDIYALSSAICLGTYTFIGSVARKELGNAMYNFLVYCATALTMIVLIPSMGLHYVGYGSINWLTALCLTLFCTLLGHSVFNWGLKYYSPTYISTIRLMDVLFSALWGFVFFHEIPVITTILGGILIVTGIVIYTREMISKEKK